VPAAQGTFSELCRAIRIASKMKGDGGDVVWVWVSPHQVESVYRCLGSGLGTAGLKECP
jgi:hypothetical protein